MHQPLWPAREAGQQTQQQRQRAHAECVGVGRRHQDLGGNRRDLAREGNLADVIPVLKLYVIHIVVYPQ